MAVAASLNVNVAANTAQFSKGMSRAKAEVSDFQKAVSLAKTGLATFGAGFTAAAVVGFLKSSVDAFEEAYKQQQKLSAVLVATGHAAGFSKQQLNDYATAIQAATNYDDDAVAGAQAVLATFRDIKGVQFTEATKAVLDLSAVMDQDLKSSAVQVGKALNDPIRGMTALRRVGVSFTQQQIDMVKQMVATNDIIGAQNLILAELKQEFGGTAAAQRSELKGLENDWGDLKEAIGGFSQTEPATAALKGVSAQIRETTAAVTGLSEATKTTASFGQKVESVANALLVWAEAQVTLGGLLKTPKAPDLTPPKASLSSKGAIGAESKADQAKAAEAADKLAMDVDKAAQAFKRQAAIAGMSSAEIKIYDLAARKADQSDIEWLKRLSAKADALEQQKKKTSEAKDAQASLAKAVEASLSSLKLEAEMAGKTAIEQELLALKTKKATDAQLEQAKAYLQQAESANRLKESISEFYALVEKDRQEQIQKGKDQEEQRQNDLAEVRERYKPPEKKAVEKRDADLKKLEGIKDRLTPQEYAEERSRINVEFVRSGKQETPRFEGNQALLKGSGQDFSAIFRAASGGKSDASKQRQQQLDTQRRIAKAVEAQAKALLKGPAVIMGELPP